MATNYIWDFATDSYLMEKDDNGVTTAVYTNEPVQYGRLISQRRGSETSYYHFDGQGSTRQLTDQNANVTDEYSYGAFGETVASSGATENQFRYCGIVGYYSGSSSDSCYVRNRHFVAGLGRWLSRDPLLFAGDSTSLYDYVINSPIGYYDPSGLKGGPMRTPPREFPPRTGRPRTGKGGRLPGTIEPRDPLCPRDPRPCPPLLPKHTPLPPDYPGRGELGIGHCRVVLSGRSLLAGPGNGTESSTAECLAL